MTPFVIGGSVLCAINTVALFCSPETQHFQKNNSFSFFSLKNTEIHDAKVVVLLGFIGIITKT